MNNSDLTTLVARGISLWAEVQNLTASNFSPRAVTARETWEQFETRNPAKLVAFVKAEQYALFDRVAHASDYDKI